jgi:ankyrin repeat protein
LLFDARSALPVPLVFVVMRLAAEFRDTTGTAGLLQREDAIALCFEVIAREDASFARAPLTGNTLLHEALSLQDVDMAQRLLDRPPFATLVNFSNHKLDRPLHLAVECGDAALVERLVKLRADVNAVNQSGYSPLHMAARHVDPECAQVLLRLGANLALTTRSGRGIEDMLPLSAAKRSEFLALIQARRVIDGARSIFSSNHPLLAAAAVLQAKSAKVAPPLPPGNQRAP